MYCVKCGNQNSDGARFCVGCGNGMSAASSENQKSAECASMPRLSRLDTRRSIPPIRRFLVLVFVGLLAAVAYYCKATLECDPTILNTKWHLHVKTDNGILPLGQKIGGGNLWDIAATKDKLSILQYHFDDQYRIPLQIESWSYKKEWSLKNGIREMFKTNGTLRLCIRDGGGISLSQGSAKGRLVIYELNVQRMSAGRISGFASGNWISNTTTNDIESPTKGTLIMTNLHE